MFFKALRAELQKSGRFFKVLVFYSSCFILVLTECRAYLRNKTRQNIGCVAAVAASRSLSIIEVCSSWWRGWEGAIRLRSLLPWLAFARELCDNKLLRILKNPEKAWQTNWIRNAISLYASLCFPAALRPLPTSFRAHKRGGTIVSRSCWCNFDASTSPPYSVSSFIIIPVATDRTERSASTSKHTCEQACVFESCKERVNSWDPDWGEKNILHGDYENVIFEGCKSLRSSWSSWWRFSHGEKSRYMGKICAARLDKCSRWCYKVKSFEMLNESHARGCSSETTDL